MLIALFRGLWQSLSESYAEWRSRQRAYAELSALDDRALADIGVSRGEIPYLLAHPYKGMEPLKLPTPNKVSHAA